MHQAARAVMPAPPACGITNPILAVSAHAVARQQTDPDFFLDDVPVIRMDERNKRFSGDLRRFVTEQRFDRRGNIYISVFSIHCKNQVAGIFYDQPVFLFVFF